MNKLILMHKVIASKLSEPPESRSSATGSKMLNKLVIDLIEIDSDLFISNVFKENEAIGVYTLKFPYLESNVGDYLVETNQFLFFKCIDLVSDNCLLAILSINTPKDSLAKLLIVKNYFNMTSLMLSRNEEVRIKILKLIPETDQRRMVSILTERHSEESIPSDMKYPDSSA